MALTINSNIASLGAQRQLGKATEQLSSVFERLSSGQRINKASDDAAGLAVADSLYSKTRIYTQAIRNINDGVSLTNIAEGALNALSDIVVRQKELAEQAANGVYAPKQRLALDKESDALTREYNRIIQSTSFNGVKILDGTDDQVRIQHGEGVIESTNVALGNAIGVQAGDGTFGAATGYTTSNGGTQGVTTGDLNGDGIVDLVSAENSSLSVFLGRGDGTFGNATAYASGGASRAVRIGDFNGDGISDLVAVNSDTDELNVFLGRGDGTFNARKSQITGDTPLSVSVADFNGDGIDDIVSADEGSNTVSVLIGQGNGTFRSRTSYATSGNPYAVKTGDFNGDGIADLVSADFSSDAVSIFIGRGDGTFNNQVAYSVGYHPQGVEVADFNGDGISDLVTSDRSDSTLSVLLGKGDGTFNTKVSYIAGSEPFSLSTGDFNGDGIVDIVSADTGSSTVGIFIGKGDGTFNSRVSYASSSGPTAVAVDDFNNDGVADLVSANSNSNTLNVLIGNVDQSLRRNNLVTALDLTSINGAKAALTKTTKLLESIGRELGNIGATQSRLEVSSRNLSVRSENYQAARSRIVDADIAAESATLIQTQILQQAASSVLAQANQIPALALSLLRQ